MSIQSQSWSKHEAGSLTGYLAAWHSMWTDFSFKNGSKACASSDTGWVRFAQTITDTAAKACWGSPTVISQISHIQFISLGLPSWSSVYWSAYSRKNTTNSCISTLSSILFVPSAWSRDKESADWIFIRVLCTISKRSSDELTSHLANGAGKSTGLRSH